RVRDPMTPARAQTSPAGRFLLARPAVVVRPQVFYLPLVPRPIRFVPEGERGTGVLELATGEAVTTLRRLDVVDTGPIQPKNLRFSQRRQRRVAVALLELCADLEGAEGLDLVLRRAVEDAVRAPEDIVFADVAEQLAKHVRGLLGVAHHRPPEIGRASCRE